MPAVRSLFPSCEIIPTGGALYFLCLNYAFHNFVTDEDHRVLNALLLLDQLLGERGESPYAVGFAFKTSPTRDHAGTGEASKFGAAHHPGEIEQAMLDYYERQLQGYCERSRVPWILRPRAWLARANRRALRASLAERKQ